MINFESSSARLLLLFTAVYFCIGAAVAQDSTMVIKRFTYDDLSTERFEKYKKQSSTNRLAENPEDLAVEVIIIDGDDIRKFGYSTLVDVLKTIPGFRTSQPGNAIEGETFLMRGLLGNDHCKILINGIPIKPEAVKSMPIAAQLPIRHAEYIEIVQGPSSSTYGSDAMAGVINIVFPEVDRPVFAWADINGITPATSEINLTLGGKSGAGENILNYQIFASSQRASDVNLNLPDDSVRLNVDSLNQFEKLFYVPDQDDLSLPSREELKRESRLVGAYLKFRSLELSVLNMYREEHSALGSKPVYSSYHDPGTTYGEKINSIGLKHVYNNNKNYISRASLSLLTFRTLTNSSYLAAQDFLSNGRNFIYARSVDYLAEYQGIFTINEKFKLAFGTTANYSYSNPYTGNLARRFDPIGLFFEHEGKDLNPSTPSFISAAADSISYIDTSTWMPNHRVGNIAGFVHFLYKSEGGKFNLELAARLDKNSFADTRFTPKVGVVYRPWKNWKFSFNYERGHRAPRSYHLYNNYWQNFNEVLANTPPGDPLDFQLKRSLDSLRTEKLQGFELRARWKINEHFTVSGRYYAHLMQNRVLRQVFTPPPAPEVGEPVDESIKVGVGYFNTDSFSFLDASMISVEWNQTIGAFEFQGLIGFEAASGWEEVFSEDFLDDTLERISGYRYMPQHSLKANLNISFKGFTISLHNNFFGNYVTEIYRKNSDVVYEETDTYFYNLDVFLHKQLFRQLSLFVGAYNVLNSVQSGIPASSVSNTWTFNPQYGRMIKFGLNFRLN